MRTKAEDYQAPSKEETIVLYKAQAKEAIETKVIPWLTLFERIGTAVAKELESEETTVDVAEQTAAIKMLRNLMIMSNKIVSHPDNQAAIITFIVESENS